MNKSDFCQCLFDDIKDDIEFDSDVVALESLLLKMLDFNENVSFKNWEYLILKYDIESLNADINFLPLIKSYPENLFKKVGEKQFFKYMEKFSDDKVKLIYRYIFNVYDPECFIYQAIDYYITENNDEKEMRVIEAVLNKSCYFSRLFFDKTELIKQVILLHIKNKNVSVELLKKLIDCIGNKKEQAVLKTLLIDYLIL